MNYKEVFQLAQDKGYKMKFEWDNPFAPSEGSIANSIIKDNPDLALCELTLIQKWLSDEKKIYTEIPLSMNGYYWILHDLSLKQDRTIKFAKTYFTTYEEALLEGVNEALKLSP